MTHITRKWLSVLSLTLLLCVLTCNICSADDTAAISIKCQYKDKMIEGVQFQLKLVATISYDKANGTLVYQMVPEAKAFSKKDAFGVERAFDNMTAAQSNAFAQNLSKSVQFDKKHIFTASTDKNGVAAITGLPAGIYLIEQSGATGVAKEYTEYKPFLCDVPFMNEDGTLQYTRTVFPKSEVKFVPPDGGNNPPPDGGKNPPPDGDGNIPTTGDNFSLPLLLGLGGVSLVAFILLLISRVKINQKDDNLD